MTDIDICLIGRPNVGKSTLFNLLTQSRQATVADFSGLTRDAIYGKLAIAGFPPYQLVDTGGLILEHNLSDGNSYQNLVNQKTLEHLAQAKTILLIADGRFPPHIYDLQIVAALRKAELLAKVFLVVNKTESLKEGVLADYYSLGIKKIFPISSSHKLGIKTLLEEVSAEILKIKPYQSEVASSAPRLSFALLGRPNAGKSTLTNAILGQKRMLVSDQRGTTRDSVATDFSLNNQLWTIYDTAGVRKRGKVLDELEKLTSIKALQTAEKVQVVVLVIDGSAEIAHQDVKLAEHCLKAGKAMVVVINKWDKLDQKAKLAFKAELAFRFAFLQIFPVLYVSANKNPKVELLLQAIKQAYAANCLTIPTPQLTRVILEAAKRQPAKGKILYAHLGSTKPPVIILHGNRLQLESSYLKYLENVLRANFELLGSPIFIRSNEKK